MATGTRALSIEQKIKISSKTSVEDEIRKLEEALFTDIDKKKHIQKNEQSKNNVHSS